MRGIKRFVVNQSQRAIRSRGSHRNNHGGHGIEDYIDVR